MQALSYQLEDLIPHRAPMILIDEVVSFDEKEQSLVCCLVVKPGWCESWVAIELMAQTAAALAGICDRMSGYDGDPRPGFLLGTRKFECGVSKLEVGKRYEIHAKCIFSDAQAASFECTVNDNDNVVARATLNAYRPSEITDFLKEQKK